MHAIDTPFLLLVFRTVARRLEENRDALCGLDGEIGDGDHGTSMANGFAAIVTALRAPGMAEAPPGQLLRTASMAFLNDVGATVGPLYASALLQAGKVLEARPDLPLSEFSAFVAALTDGIAFRGKARAGDKTMLDAWLAATHAARLQESLGAPPADVARKAAEAAEEEARATATMIASRGRAARLKERSLGHQDPGAVSAALILRVLADAVADTMGQGR
ncbi:dihydroxyacetone kinase subunit L [bacterium]|nr:dihydroxyacetone kinase subunit L [bacterium]